jgi:hypothetical protein
MLQLNGRYARIWRIFLPQVTQNKERRIDVIS